MLSESGSESESTAIPWSSPLAPRYLSKESESTLIPLSSSKAPRSSSTEIVWLYQNNHPHHINVVRLIKDNKDDYSYGDPNHIDYYDDDNDDQQHVQPDQYHQAAAQEEQNDPLPCVLLCLDEFCLRMKGVLWLSTFSFFNVFWTYLFNKRTQIIWNECTNNLIRLDLLGLSIHKSDSQSTWTSPFQSWAPKKIHFLVETMF